MHLGALFVANSKLLLTIYRKPGLRTLHTIFRSEAEATKYRSKLKSRIHTTILAKSPWDTFKKL